MSKEALEKFGAIVIREIRDASIDHWERILDGRMKGQSAKETHARIQIRGQQCQEQLREMIPKIVDTALHHMMCTLETHEDIDLHIQSPKGGVENLRESSDGLAGELYGDTGWIAKFSSVKENTK
ncbi:MAG: hypothetical protein DHS20C16_34480 [Phycisphaerae bacterium]|nr:MAG: hypothetical protein DHS20C16_34480 [Phycisphaerae bacterium]